VFYGIDKGVEI